MADDLGYADLSSYGRTDYSTPNIDRVGAEGLKLLQAYANSPVCSATRTALITGRYQYRLRVGLEEPLNDSTPADVGLPPSHPTLPSLLKRAGYGSTLIGKWHLGSLPDFSPIKSGYDRFFGIFGGSADYFVHGKGSYAQLHEDEVPIERQGYMTNLLTERGLDALDGYARSKQPFLLSMHYTSPHWPWEGPDDEAEARRLKPNITSIQHFDGGSQKTYATMVQNLDMNVGRLLQALDRSGLAANTIVIFTSDNGGERFSMNWPFTGMKTELLEGGVRIPAMVRWPGRIRAGTVSEQVMISMDWMPTLLAAAGSAPDPAYPPDGENLLGVITGAQPVHRRKLFWRYKAASQRSVREGDMKYLRIGGSEFLFDVVQDPRERANLRERRKDVFERLRGEWEQWNAPMLAERPGPVSPGTPGRLMADHFGVPSPQKPPPD